MSASPEKKRWKRDYFWLPIACFCAVLPASCAFLFITTHNYWLMFGMLPLTFVGYAARKADGK